jgi:hypothetical protein
MGKRRMDLECKNLIEEEDAFEQSKTTYDVVYNDLRPVTIKMPPKNTLECPFPKNPTIKKAGIEVPYPRISRKIASWKNFPNLREFLAEIPNTGFK